MSEVQNVNKIEVIQRFNSLSALRIKYKEKRDVFREESISPKDPIDLFGKWLNEATSTEEILEPNAMCLATVNKLAYCVPSFCHAIINNSIQGRIPVESIRFAQEL